LKRAPPPQIENLLAEIKESIESRNFRFSQHAITRTKERSISPRDVINVLINGFHEKKKTIFDPASKTWKYAIRGNTVDNEEIRVIVALVEEMLIITVIKLV
jgi:hypothetical protein